MSKGKKPVRNIAEENILNFQNKFKVVFNKIDLKPKQKEFFRLALDENTKILFITGPAGTGKSFLSIYAALQIFNKNTAKDIIYLRTVAESAEKSLGSLPGDMNEKFLPYILPLKEKVEEIVKAPTFKTLYEEEIVSAIPVNFLRGASWRNKIVVADEAQNFSYSELVTFLTRIGEDTKYFICGDLMQSDIRNSGFKEVISRFDNEESRDKGIHVIKFTSDDIMRSEILKFIVSQLEK